MTQAGNKSNWILLSKAKERAGVALGSLEYAERKLTQWLRARELRARSADLEGSKGETDPGLDAPEFWGDELVVSPYGDYPKLFIHWAESWARRDSYTFYAIKVHTGDLDRLLRAGAADDRITTAAWIYGEARRLKVAGQLALVSTERKTDLAELLSRQLNLAAADDPSLRAVSVGYIRDNLEGWGLWLISEI